MSFFLHEINYGGEFQKRKRKRARERERRRDRELPEKETREVLRPELD